VQRFGSPQLGYYSTHADRPYVAEWMSKNQALLGLGVAVEQPELRTHPWEIDVPIDARERRSEKWQDAAVIVGVLAGVASVAAIMGWIR